MRTKTSEMSRRPSFDQAVIELPARQTRLYFRVSAPNVQGELLTFKDKVEKDVKDKQKEHNQHIT